MSQPIKQRLESSLSTAAASGRAIANYMLANLYELPFQTAADIAAKLNVSESSVGRFCRSIGYSHFKDLKNDLKADLGDGPWLVGDRLQEFRQQASQGPQGLPRSFELEVAALVKVYEYSLTPPGTPSASAWPAGARCSSPGSRPNGASPPPWCICCSTCAMTCTGSTAPPGITPTCCSACPPTAPWWCSKPAAIRATP